MDTCSNERIGVIRLLNAMMPRMWSVDTGPPPPRTRRHQQEVRLRTAWRGSGRAWRRRALGGGCMARGLKHGRRYGRGFAPALPVTCLPASLLFD